MSRWNDDGIIGFTANRLTVEAIVGFTPAGKRLVRVRCQCGTVKTVILAGMRSGKAKSCGCMLREKSAERMKSIRHLGEGNRLRHGQTLAPEYYIWRSMKARCLNPETASYHRYGGRGITVCERWLISDNFLADMGPRPSPKHQLDRIDNDGNYEPSNCRWATAVEQGRNRSTNVNITHNGMTFTMVEWAERLGITKLALWHRLQKGWSLDRCLVGPIRHRSSNPK